MIKDMNELAVEVTRREGGVINLSIAQVKEVLAHVSDITYEDKIQNGHKNDTIRIGNMLLINGSHRALAKKNKS